VTKRFVPCTGEPVGAEPGALTTARSKLLMKVACLGESDCPSQTILTKPKSLCTSVVINYI